MDHPTLALTTVEPDKSIQLVVFNVQNRELALPVTQVSQVLRMVALTPIPDAPAWLPGVINLRGAIMPMMDLQIRLGFSSHPLRLSNRIIITQFQNLSLGLIVDTVSNVINASYQAIENINTTFELSQFAPRILRLESRLILILDLERLSADTQLSTLGTAPSH